MDGGLTRSRLHSLSNCITAKPTITITMLGYALALIPLYLFVYLPISSMLSGTVQQPLNPAIASFNLNDSSIASDEPLSCPDHSYTTHILSHEPLIIYIEDFLSADESAHLLKIRYSLFHLKPSIGVQTRD